MSKNKSSISRAQTYEEIGEFWDAHDLSDYWDETRPAEFEVDIQSVVVYYAVDSELSTKIQAFARKRGISPDTLLNLWLQEKLQEQQS
jgi:hypothetical protein